MIDVEMSSGNVWMFNKQSLDKAWPGMYNRVNAGLVWVQDKSDRALEILAIFYSKQNRNTYALVHWHSPIDPLMPITW